MDDRRKRRAACIRDGLCVTLVQVGDDFFYLLVAKYRRVGEVVGRGSKLLARESRKSLQQPQNLDYLFHPVRYGNTLQALGYLASSGKRETDAAVCLLQQRTDGGKLRVVRKRILHEVLLQLDVHPVHVIRLVLLRLGTVLHAVRQSRPEENQVARPVVDDAVAHQTLAVPLFHEHQFVLAVEVPRIRKSAVIVEARPYRVRAGDGNAFVQNLFHDGREKVVCKNTQNSCKNTHHSVCKFTLFLHQTIEKQFSL